MQEDVGPDPAIHNRLLLSHDSGCTRGGLDEAKRFSGSISSIRGDIGSHVVLDLIHSVRPQDGLLLLPLHWPVRALLLRQRQRLRSHQEYESAHRFLFRRRRQVVICCRRIDHCMYMCILDMAGHSLFKEPILLLKERKSCFPC